MAGNFWQSSHCAQWLLERVDLARERHSDLQHLSEDDYQKIIIFFAGFIQTLGEQLKLRQQASSNEFNPKNSAGGGVLSIRKLALAI